MLINLKEQNCFNRFSKLNKFQEEYNASITPTTDILSSRGVNDFEKFYTKKRSPIKQKHNSDSRNTLIPKNKTTEETITYDESLIVDGGNGNENEM